MYNGSAGKRTRAKPLYILHFTLFILNKNGGGFGAAHREAVTRYVQADGIAKGRFTVQTNRFAGQATHFEQLQGSPLIAKRLNPGVLTGFQIGYGAVAHGGRVYLDSV
jgi:hypothetical protein